MEAGIYRDRFHDVAAKDEFRQQQYTTKKATPNRTANGCRPHLLARAFNVDCEGPNSFTKPATKAASSAPSTAASASCKNTRPPATPPPQTPRTNP